MFNRLPLQVDFDHPALGPAVVGMGLSLKDDLVTGPLRLLVRAGRGETEEAPVGDLSPQASDEITVPLIPLRFPRRPAGIIGREGAREAGSEGLLHLGGIYTVLDVVGVGHP